MQYLAYTPAPPIGRFVEKLWYFEGPDLAPGLESILPKATMSLLVNLAEDELRWYEGGEQRRCHRLSGACIGGAFDEHFAIDTAEQRAIVGAEFTPGGAFVFFPPPADALASDHVPLEDVWGLEGHLMRERVLEAPSPLAKLRVLESVLVCRARRPLVRPPEVEFALAAFEDSRRPRPVAEVVSSLGMSDRRFVRIFSEHVGLSP